MFNLFKKKDSEIIEDVEKELKWDQRVSSNHLSVSSHDGIVSLRGTVPHYFDKSSAEKATQRVKGVRAVANEIEVDMMDSYKKK